MIWVPQEEYRVRLQSHTQDTIEGKMRIKILIVILGSNHNRIGLF